MNHLPQLLAQAVEQGASGNCDLVFEYEDGAAEHFRSPWAISTSSGTMAIAAALRALDVEQDDEVVVPATAPVMSLLPILALGARPVICDVRGSRSFGLCFDDLRRLVGLRTGAVILVPMWGYWDEDPDALAWLRERSVPTVLDASQAHHLTVGATPLSGLAELVCVSTHARKPLSTGEGGLVLTREERLAAKVRTLRNFGQPAKREGGRLLPVGNFGESPGVNLKLNGLGAALGISNLRALPADLDQRRASRDVLDETISELGGEEQSSTPGSQPGLYGYCFSVDGVTRERFAPALDDLVEVETERYSYDILQRAPVANDYDRDCPRAESLVRSMCAIRLAGVDSETARAAAARLRAWER
jgi:perosamine synthetase